jgi:hypothetical protein
MARTADTKSKRQTGFRLLNQITTQRMKPAKRLATVMAKLGVDKPYAETIIATHKRLAKADGRFINVYRVKDQKNGKPCKPYMSSHGVYKVAVKKSDFTSADAAKDAYIQEQASKINLVERL